MKLKKNTNSKYYIKEKDSYNYINYNNTNINSAQSNSSEKIL